MGVCITWQTNIEQGQTLKLNREQSTNRQDSMEPMFLYCLKEKNVQSELRTLEATQYLEKSLVYTEKVYGEEAALVPPFSGCGFLELSLLNNWTFAIMESL